MVEQSAVSRRSFAAMKRRAEMAEQRAEAAEARAEAADRRAEEAERRLHEGGKAARHAKDEPTYRATMDGFRKRLDVVERRLLGLESGQQMQVDAVPTLPSGHSDQDLLHGLEAVAAHLGMTTRQAKRRAAAGGLPTFRIGHGRTICARRSTLNAWLAAQEGR